MMGSVNNICSKIAYYYDFDQWNWRGVCSKYCPCLTFLHGKFGSQWQSSSVSQPCSLPNHNCDEVSKQQSYAPTPPTTHQSKEPEKECDANPKLIQESFAKAIERLGINQTPLEFTEKGGDKVIRIVNPSGQRMALKVKCTNNDLIRAKPVHSFLEPYSTKVVHIFRLPSSSKKTEQIGLFVVKTEPWETEPNNPFTLMLDDEDFCVKFTIPVNIVQEESI